MLRFQLTDEIPKVEAEWYALVANARNYFTSADAVGLAVVANNAGASCALPNATGGC